MCGISGFFGSEQLKPDLKKINKTLNLMKFRGPNGSNFYQNNKIENVNLTFLHSRLSIIDPYLRSNQPMKDNEGVLIFNGMIFNYHSIRKKLQKKKIKFLTNSDTEVLLKFLNLYGVERIDALDGMWSFAYYNFSSKKLILSRDRFGEKPLYYYKDINQIIFGSNLNYILNLSSLKFDINYQKFEEYLKFGFRVLHKDDNTFFKNIYSLKPGTYIEFTNDFQIREKTYWNPLKFKINSYLNYDNEKKKLINVYKSILKERTVSDFPIACLLSGGVDSSSIVSVLSKLKKKKLVDCFSIRSKNLNYDESYFIKKTIEYTGCNHKYIDVDKDNINNIKEIDEIVKNTCSVLPTSTGFIFSKICKEIKENKYKVILSGLGGDEMFAGYYLHHLHYLYSIKNKAIFKKKYREWCELVRPLLRSDSLRNFNKYKKNINIFDPMFTEFFPMKKYFNKFLHNKYSNLEYFNDHLKNQLYKDIIYSSLPSQLYMNDNVSMYYGLENRAPLLSKKIFEKAFTYPGSFLIRSGYNKSIFRDSLKNYVNQEILQNRNKIGFYMSVDDLFDFRDTGIKKLIFSNKFVNSLVNIKKIRKLLVKKNKNNQESHLIFSIINVVLFLKQYAA
jgi:asparagine synthase (glutamine-hydrolysing)